MVGLRINSAPGKELIPKIIHGKQFEDFNQFFDLRVQWHPYPLISDRCISYSIFWDLTRCAVPDDETLHGFIKHCVRIAEKEDDKKFLYAIFLMSEFCSKKRTTAPTDELIDKILHLEPKIKMHWDYPNLISFWNGSILKYCLLNDY